MPYIQDVTLYLYQHNSNKLNEEIDHRHGGVSIHLGQIADIMYEWEGPVAEYLGLTRADIAAIKMKYPVKLKLQA